jgi:hypothetical protein
MHAFSYDSKIKNASWHMLMLTYIHVLYMELVSKFFPQLLVTL